ncbi:uncharacterized protein KIAA0754-like isoform X1 [Daphnia pulex]|uniref:uncharacterized protein KIAA0754-like isoform X1 n=1 Tax=Daphnia pulex TaxID=6669 RepID=UPI001EDF2D83|nr:uncharacterized protein KIAA0754-like isoform X1 [Daphnia pulex]
MLSVGILLICLWTSAIAGNSSSALNATGSNASAISTSQLPFGINMSDLPKSMRNISYHTIQTILASHPKMRIPNVGAKHNKTVIVANATDASKTASDVTLPTTLRNLTQHIKNGGHRSSSSRLLDRLASKVSLVSLTSSKVSDVSNKTSPLRNERASINATLIELKNATDRINNKTIEKRSADNTSMTDRASSFFQTLPGMLANTTSNVTSWARRLFRVDSESSRNAATKKVTRDTAAAELELVKALVNTSALNSTSTEKLGSTVAAKKDNSSLATIIERAVGNLTADIPAVKESNSSAVNSSKSGIKGGAGSQVVEVPLKRQNDSTVEGEHKVAKLTEEIPEKTANSSLIAKSSASPDNRTKRHLNGGRGSYNVIPSRPSPGRVPVYGRPPAAASQTYGMVPPTAYGMTPASPATTTPAVPVYVYNTPASYAPPATSAPAYGIAPASPTYTTPAPAAPAYGMAPAAPVPAAAYGMAPATPAPAPAYGMAPAAPVPAPAYGMAPAAPAPAYGMAPATPASAPAYGMAPAAPAPAYGMAPAAPAPTYGMAPAAPAPAYGMASATPAPAPSYGMAPASPAPGAVYGMAPTPAPAPSYGMAPVAPAPAPAPVYGMAPGAPIYATPVPVAAPAYEQTTASYYTAPAPLYTTNIPSNLQPTPTPYGALPLPIYSAQPYGSMPSPPSPTASPWYK